MEIVLRFVERFRNILQIDFWHLKDWGLFFYFLKIYFRVRLNTDPLHCRYCPVRRYFTSKFRLSEDVKIIFFEYMSIKK